jgi:hypothetical protein
MKKYDAKAKRETKRKAVKETIIGQWDQYGQPVQPHEPIQPSKTALVFPSESCADVQEALEVGRITTDTHLIVVERVKKSVPIIKRKLRGMGFSNVTYHIGSLDSLNLSACLERGERLDYAFFDVCGMVTHGLLQWFERNLTDATVAKDAHVAFTFDCSGRIKDTFWTAFSEHDSSAFLGLFTDRHFNRSARPNNMNDTIHFQVYAVYVALHRFSVSIGCVTSYNDTGCPMQVFDMTIRKAHKTRTRQMIFQSLMQR